MNTLTKTTLIALAVAALAGCSPTPPQPTEVLSNMMHAPVKSVGSMVITPHFNSYH